MAALADRRRFNGPACGTSTPAYKPSPLPVVTRTRAPGQLRRIFLKTGLTPSASGSAYFEQEPSNPPDSTSHLNRPNGSGLKLTCTVHGPRPLPRSTAFTPQLVLSTRVKYAPCASRQRRAYAPNSNERDLAAHLDAALRGILIGERWPKSGVDVVITVLEGEEEGAGWTEGWESMSVLAGCITVASAAIADAGIDCVDLVTGGVAALIQTQIMLDPSPTDHAKVEAACVVGYLQSRDEVTEMWATGKENERGALFESLMDNAVEAAKAARFVLVEALDESTERKIQQSQFDSIKT